jgi:hypothetical protein
MQRQGCGGAKASAHRRSVGPGDAGRSARNRGQRMCVVERCGQAMTRQTADLEGGFGGVRFPVGDGVVIALASRGAHSRPPRPPA